MDSTNALPKHIGIIMDGNGRWAQKRALPRSLGHRAGMERLRGIIRMSSDIGIKSLTIYAFSTENWKRPEEEVSGLFKLLVEYFYSEIDELHKNRVRIRILGDKSRFPKQIFDLLDTAETRTEKNDGLQLNIALNYGARAETVRAIKEITDMVSAGEITTAEIDEKLYTEKLYTAGQDDIDLVIRTGGEMRLSNFFLMQAAYAELYFTDVLWPDFSNDEYQAALDEFARRNRRFGGVK